MVDLRLALKLLTLSIVLLHAITDSDGAHHKKYQFRFDKHRYHSHKPSYKPYRPYKPHRPYKPYKPYCDLKCQQAKDAKAIRDMYKMAAKLSGGLFAVSKKDAMNLTNLANQEIRQPSSQCERKLPKFTSCKIEELQHIYSTSPCKTTNVTKNDEIDEMQNEVDHDDDDIMRDDDDGSVTTIRRPCLARGSTSLNNNLRLCEKCAATTVLAQNIFPRYLNEVICDPRKSRCLRGEGRCLQNYIFVEFRKDTKEVGFARLGEWIKIQQRVRTSCSCQVLPNSHLFRRWVN